VLISCVIMAVLTHDCLPTTCTIRAVRDDPSDVILETLIEHSIGLIENEVGDSRDVSG
jgi:hypothetical protein